MKRILWYFTFLLTLFITLLILIYFKQKVKPEIKKNSSYKITLRNIENFNTESNMPPDMPISKSKDDYSESDVHIDVEYSETSKCYSTFNNNINEYTIEDGNPDFPFKNNILMSISTFKNNIVNEELKWYDHNNFKNERLTDSVDNDRLWFEYSNPIELVNYSNISKTANLNNIQLEGPKSSSFSNSNIDLGNFSAIFSLKINNIRENLLNCLFELYLQPSASYGDKITKSESVISILLKNNNTDCLSGFDLILYFGKERYYWTNISKNILNKNSVIILTYDVSTKKIDLYIDNLYKTFNYSGVNLKLGSEKMIINKMGNIDMELTQFIYYNKYFTINDVDIYNQVYNYYLNNKNMPFNHRNTEIENLQNTNISLQDKINTLRNKVNQYELK